MKNIFFLTLTLFTGIPFLIQGQPSDTLVYLDEIQYTSAIEERIFKDYFLNNKQDYLGLFMAISESLTEEKYENYSKKFSYNLADINTEKILNKNNKKKIKLLYSEVHDRFLTKYELENHFSSIFSNGFYNCVSGSALYALVFEELSIPYKIKEKPTHVYLMTYPEAEQILVEPTDPRMGYLSFTDSYKSGFIENLKAAKIISDNEARNTPVNELFDKYYFAEEEITLKQLVGVQYTNDAIYKLEKQNLEEAKKQLEKAYLFYPSQKVASLLFMVNAQLLSNSSYEEPEDATLLARLSRFHTYGIQHKDITGEFARANNLILIDRDDTEFYKTFFEEVVKNLQDEELINEISFIYYFENGRVLYNTGKYSDALEFLRKAYTLKPQNHDINNLFVSSIGQSLRNESDPKTIILVLEEFKDTYEGLMEHNLFKSMLVSSYLTQFYYSFNLHKPTEGLKYKTLFEKYYTKDLNIEESLIGRAYGSAATFYFRKGNKSKAVNLLNEGLDITPNNYELITRKRMIN